MSRATPIRFEFGLDPGAVTRLLLATAAVLIACHVGLSVYHYRVHHLPWLLRQIFDVDEEDALPTWFSTMLLAFASLCLWRCVELRRALDGAWTAYWRVLCGGFLLMSVDEVAGIHETLNSALPEHWTTWAAALVAVVGIAYLPFLARLPRPTAIRFVLSGAIFVGGAIGVEIIGEPVDADSLAYNLLTALEEGMEMLGVIVFVDSVLRYLGPGAAGSR